jgi:hypothetical protein
MSYFADMTPHTYTRTGLSSALNIGWLDASFPFAQGDVPPTVLRTLQNLCDKPLHLHRGFHECQFCPRAPSTKEVTCRGNGQIRIEGEGGVIFVAPTMIYHYVSAHHYLPPAAFIAAVLRTHA